jgi:hypothetical protein
MIVTCPHCKEPCIIQEINCGIFRHGVFKKSGKQMNPHESKQSCERYIKQDKIFGCGKPFRVIKKADSETKPGEAKEKKKEETKEKEDNYAAIICDYI